MIWVGQQNAPSNMKKILFLGYDKDKTQLIEQIQTHNNHWKVKQTSKKITLGEIKDLDLIISFGYRDIINNEIISHFKKPIINLHLSFNKGAHPNFWSFIDYTPSGISIHEIDGGIDTGKIIYQKKIDFDLTNNKKKLNFYNTYSILFKEIENLFMKNIDELINNKFNSYAQIGNGSYHSKKDLPKLLKNWNQNIYETVIENNRMYKKNEK